MGSLFIIISGFLIKALRTFGVQSFFFVRLNIRCPKKFILNFKNLLKFEKICVIMYFREKKRTSSNRNRSFIYEMSLLQL